MPENKRTKRQYRLSVNVPAWLFESINNAGIETSLSALVVKLLKVHLLDHELKQEFMKLNNRAIN